MGAPQFIPSSYRQYAVDGDGDGRRDLFGNWDDVLASVANYFVAHNWRAGEPVVTRATLAQPVNQTPKDNDLSPGGTVDSLGRQGVRFSTDLAGPAPAGLLALDGDEGSEYWVAFHNFYVITRTTHVLYALLCSAGQRSRRGRSAPMERCVFGHSCLRPDHGHAREVADAGAAPLRDLRARAVAPGAGAPRAGGSFPNDAGRPARCRAIPSVRRLPGNPPFYEVWASATRVPRARVPRTGHRFCTAGNPRQAHFQRRGGTVSLPRPTTLRCTTPDHHPRHRQEHLGPGHAGAGQEGGSLTVYRRRGTLILNAGTTMVASQTLPG